MGWDTWDSAQDAKAHATIGDYLAAQYTMTCVDGTRQDVVAWRMGWATSSDRSERVWYAALRVRSDASPFGVCFADARDFTTAVVVLVNGQWGRRVGTKGMDEIMGPYERACPVEVLDRLTPLSDHKGGDYARRWRDECRANLGRRAA